MNKIVGIDLGTTNSAVATVDSGIPLLIPDPDGRRLTPSVVFYPASGGQIVTGAKACRLRVLDPANTVYSVKRFMGRRAGELTDEERSVSYRLSGQGDQPITAEVGGARRSPEEISAEILRKLKVDAETYLGEMVSRAVITVPAYFNDAQRIATKRAGELAGFTVERIVNEPTAAALAYGLDRLKERSKIAVYDLGGGTFDLSILELNAGVFQVLSTHGDTRLGGDDLDQRVAGWIAARLQEMEGADASRHPIVVSRIREAAEAAKIALSTEVETVISLPFVTPNFNFECKFLRSELESLTRDLIDRTRSHCLRALADAKLEANELDQVILVGGQTRMPLVRETVQQIFECADFESAEGTLRIGSEYHRRSGPMLNTSQNPEEAIALGAAIQAEILAGGFKNLLLLDVTPLSLGLETFGGLMNVIIPRNSTIPTKAGEVFTTAIAGQTSMLIHVLQGERERARDNWSLGRFTLEFESAPKGVARVGVQFEIDANGILHVLARDLKDGTQRILDLQSAVDVNDSDVQRMVEESVDHAFEDLRSRRWIEVKIRAHETIGVARKGLSQCHGETSSAELEEIETAIRLVEKALSSEDPGTITGNLEELKSALAQLDQSTQPLAERLMDKAMDTVLRKRGIIS